MHDILNIASQILATGLTAAAFGSLIAWGKRDARERREREREARKRAWEREIERAGRRMMEADERRRIMAENRTKRLHVTLKGEAEKYAEAWK